MGRRLAPAGYLLPEQFKQTMGITAARSAGATHSFQIASDSHITLDQYIFCSTDPLRIRNDLTSPWNSGEQPRCSWVRVLACASGSIGTPGTPRHPLH